MKKTSAKKAVKPAAKKAPKKDPDSALLDRYDHHTSMAQKHRAHADLIEAKLKTQGKRIGYDHGHGNAAVSSPKMKRKIVPNDDRY